MKIAVMLLALFFTLSAYETASDSKNTYLSSEHFRVIYGAEYANSVVVSSLAATYLDIAENVWQKEVVELAFKAPKNSQTKKIDIYIGNKDAYNYETENYETIPSYYAGWAAAYPSDDTPYFLINPNMSKDITKVTIAHEFFHTIQYAYFDTSLIPDAAWEKDIWWMEATAVSMEDEVYDSVNDYINYLGPFFSASYRSFEINNGSHEYAMVIFAKYLEAKYGFEILKNSFLTMASSLDESFFSILDDLLRKNHHSSMQKELNEFVKRVANPAKYFKDGKLFPALRHFRSSDAITFGKGGVAVIDNLEKGWNMVPLTTIDKDVNASSNDPLPLVWSYENGVWKNSAEDQIDETNSSKGYWVKVDTPSSLNYTYYDVKADANSSVLDNSWHLLGVTTVKDLNATYKDSEVLLWQYQNGKWSAYSNNQNLHDKIKENNFAILHKLNAFSGYWVKGI